MFHARRRIEGRDRGGFAGGQGVELESVPVEPLSGCECELFTAVCVSEAGSSVETDVEN